LHNEPDPKTIEISRLPLTDITRHGHSQIGDNGRNEKNPTTRVGSTTKSFSKEEERET